MKLFWARNCIKLLHLFSDLLGLLSMLQRLWGNTGTISVVHTCPSSLGGSAAVEVQEVALSTGSIGHPRRASCGQSPWHVFSVESQ